MRGRRGFTLAELLVVIAIMMILAAGSFSVLALVGQQRGPSAALPAVQSMCNAARDNAITTGRPTRIRFERPSLPNSSDAGPRTVMTLEYMKPNKSTWDPVQGQVETSIGERLVVLNGTPSGLPTDPASTDYRSNMLSKLKTHLSTSTNAFYLVFDGSGAVDSSGSSTVQGTLVVVDLSADGQVNGYAFYPINRNTGTRLVFE